MGRGGHGLRSVRLLEISVERDLRRDLEIAICWVAVLGEKNAVLFGPSDFLHGRVGTLEVRRDDPDRSHRQLLQQLPIALLFRSETNRRCRRVSQKVIQN